MKTPTYSLLTIGILVALATACRDKASHASDQAPNTVAADTSKHPPAGEEDGMRMVHRGMEMVSTGRILWDKAQAAQDNVLLEKGMKIMDEGMDMIAMGRQMMGDEKPKDSPADKPMTDDMDKMSQPMSMMDDAMEMMSMGKDTAAQGMASMNTGAMKKGMGMMDKGMKMMGKGAGAMQPNPMAKDPMPKDKPMMDDDD